MMLFIGGLGTSEVLMLLILFFGPAILWIWALIDALKSDFKDGSTKILWVLVLILLPVVGWLLYLTIGRSQRLVT